MHVPEESLELYRAIATLARKADSIANVYSGKGRYADANRVWGIAGDLRATAFKLRVPGTKEENNGSNTPADQRASPGDSQPSPGDS